MRIALCLTGLIGSLKGKSWLKNGGSDKIIDLCYEHTKKHILDKNDVDVFFHTWDLEFVDKLKQKYKPKRFSAQKQKVFNEIIPQNTNRVQAHYSKWYSIGECIKMKKLYEYQNKFRYDFVLQCRFDLVWNIDINFNNYEQDKFYIPRTSKKGKPWGWPNESYHEEIGDLFFFSSSKNMDNFSKLYEEINYYLLDGCPTFDGISNHMLAKWHLKELGLLEDKTELVFDDMVPDFVIARKFI